MNNRPFAFFYLANRETDPDLPDELSRVESASVNLETDVVVIKIFYDSDEICFRTDINFRNLPVSDNVIAVGVVPWFEVGKFDVFPGEFSTFLFPERSIEIESGRKLPPDIVELGGSEVHPSTLVETIKQVVVGDLLYQGGGDSSIFEKSVLRRCFRDINVTTQDTMVASPIDEVVVV